MAAPRPCSIASLVSVHIDICEFSFAPFVIVWRRRSKLILTIPERSSGRAASLPDMARAIEGIGCGGV
jgi:hypothetical protein